MGRLRLLGTGLILILLCGCRTSTKTVEMPVAVPVVLHDTVRQNTLRRDSVLIRDSIYVEGEKIYRDRLVRSVRILTDTLYVARRDTIRVPQPYPVEKEVERELRWYDNACLQIGRLCLIALLLWLIFLYIKRKG